MADEIITVEWIATAQQMLTTIQKIDQKIERQEKLMQKLTDTTKKGAVEAAGSFNRLEQDLKENEAALKKLVIGSKEFDDQRRKVDALRGSLNRAKHELTGLRSGAATFGDMKTALLGGAAAAGSLVMALQKIAQAQRDIINTGSDAAVEIDTMARRMQIQAGLTDPQRETQSVSIIEQSTAAGVKAETGFQAATQLASSGFADPVNSGTLATALKAMQASNFKGTPEEFIQGMSQVLAGYGMDKTNENLERVAMSMQGLFKVTDFQITEATDFARNAALFESAGLSLEQSMAGFAAAREVLPAEQAGTGMRNTISILQSAAGHRVQTEALATLGITPEEVDLVGENLQQVLTRLNAGLEAADDKTRQLAMDALFGRESKNAATVLAGRVGRIDELEGLQGNKAQFEADARTAQESMQAGRNRLANEELRRLVPIADALEVERTRMEQRNAQLRGLERQAAVDIGAPAAATIRAGGATLSTIEDATGADVVGGAMRGEAMSTSFGIAMAQWFMSSDKKQEEANRLLAEQNELLRQQRQAPAQRQVPARNIRPGEAPLPGAQAP